MPKYYWNKYTYKTRAKVSVPPNFTASLKTKILKSSNWLANKVSWWENQTTLAV